MMILRQQRTTTTSGKSTWITPVRLYRRSRSGNNSNKSGRFSAIRTRRGPPPRAPRMRSSKRRSAFWTTFTLIQRGWGSTRRTRAIRTAVLLVVPSIRATKLSSRRVPPRPCAWSPSASPGAPGVVCSCSSNHKCVGANNNNKSLLVYPTAVHTSVVGMRGAALLGGADVCGSRPIQQLLADIREASRRHRDAAGQQSISFLESVWRQSRMMVKDDGDEAEEATTQKQSD